MESKVYVVACEDRTGKSDTIFTMMGVFTSLELAKAAVLDWVFDDGAKMEGVESLPFDQGYEYITDKTVWKIEEFEVDTVY